MKKIITSNEFNVDETKISTIYKTGNITELITPYHRNDSLKKFRKLNKTQYVDCETGEIKEYKYSNSRSNNIQSIQRSLANLRRIINSNFTGDNSERFLTLTSCNNADKNCLSISITQLFCAWILVSVEKQKRHKIGGTEMIEILYDSEGKLPKNVAIIDNVNVYVYVNDTSQNSKSEKSDKTKNEVNENGK